MVVLKAENISKKYVLNHQANNHAVSLKESMRSLFSKSKNTKTKEEFWALNGVDFEIKAGDRVGIVGANGAGKSTLLKILSRITDPTKGQLEITGRVASLLEVGTGFHPELTGRENIYLNGSILGMKKHEITFKFDEIVDFSGVERFLDTPVKRYSSGMYVRLGFAIAAHLDPDIFIVDEVLAVGDSEFQKKCMGKMQEVSTQGRTVLFVSHNLTAVDALCNKGIFLHKGVVKDDGPAKKVINTYLNTFSKNVLKKTFENLNEAPGNDEVKINSIELKPDYLIGQNTIDVRTPLNIELSFTTFNTCNQLNVSLFVIALTGEVVFNVGSELVGGQAGKYNASCHIPAPLLNDGSYTISALIVKNSTDVLFNYEEPITFEVADWRIQEGDWHGKWPGIIRPSLAFTLKKDTI
jgi:lipopolysaccharide transport system ATP-binding protein